MTNQQLYVDLMQRANRAALDAIAWARDPNGVKMARVRARDARALRWLASAILRS